MMPSKSEVSRSFEFAWIFQNLITLPKDQPSRFSVYCNSNVPNVCSPRRMRKKQNDSNPTRVFFTSHWPNRLTLASCSCSRRLMILLASLSPLRPRIGVETSSLSFSGTSFADGNVSGTKINNTRKEMIMKSEEISMGSQGFISDKAPPMGIKTTLDRIAADCM